MKASLILADAAQADPTGKVYALGIGWSVTGTPTPPMALVILIDCPWDQTNSKHKVVIDLLDQDGHPVSFAQGPLGNPEPALRIEAEFEVGRPPGVPVGSPQRNNLAINIAGGLPLTPGQNYEFHMTIDDDHIDAWLATFMVRP